MNRLFNAIKWDIIFQFKYGLYIAGVILTLVWLSVLSMFSGEAAKLALILVLVSDVSTMGLLFVGAILYFEKGQGSINAVITTPLKTREYVLSKVVSLTLFVSLFTILLTLGVAIIKGISINYFYMLVGVLLTAVTYILAGFFLSTYYKTFTDFLLPMGLIFGFLNLPLFDLFHIEVLESVSFLFYLVPTHGLIRLLNGMVSIPSLGDTIYAVFYNFVVISLLYKGCIRNFNTRIVGRSGDIDG